MKSFIKPAVIIPMLLGIAVAALLLTLGQADDAPGLGGIGLIAGFLLIMLGIRNTGLVKKGILLPLMFICFGAGGILLSIALQLDGELTELPAFAPIGTAAGALLIVIGSMKLRKKGERKNA